MGVSVGVKRLVKQVLTEKENRRYGRLLKEKKIAYNDWFVGQERCRRQEDPDGYPEETRLRTDGLHLSCAAQDVDYVLIRVGKGSMALGAEKRIRRYFMENPEVQVIYGDEDVRTADGKYASPWYKPDWSPDFLDSCPYFGGLTAVRRGHWEEQKRLYDRVFPGRWQAVFSDEKESGSCFVTDFMAYEEWLHGCVDSAYRKGGGLVGHIPQILFHGESREEQRRFLEESDFLRAKRHGLLTGFYDCFVNGRPAQQPVVSVVIPSKDHPAALGQCLEGVKRAAADIPLEVIVVDNGSGEENRAAAERMLREMTEDGAEGTGIGIRYIYSPMEFNFSGMCNLGAKQAEGELLLFLNDDVFLEKDCIREAAARAVRSYTGAVGIKLLYPNSGRIQHAGITNLPMGPVHKLQSLRDDSDYYGKANNCSRNYLAVTAACLMVEKNKFREAGGFCEELPVAFNDVDLCFRLYELGYHNVCLNDTWACHHESLSRGDDEAPDRLKRLLAEKRKLYERHPKLEGRDPYYSVHLNREGLDVRIAPAYLTSLNRVQSAVEWKPLAEPADCREDRCLLVRVEDVGAGKMVGWCVVLGDDNACYEKKLLLERRAGTDGVLYGITLKGQYRPDLEENMPDQKNVALGGFLLEAPEGILPPGTYRIGAYARNRVTGLKLINWSSREFENACETSAQAGRQNRAQDGKRAGGQSGQ